MKEKNCDCLFDLFCNIRSSYEFVRDEFIKPWYK